MYKNDLPDDDETLKNGDADTRDENALVPHLTTRISTAPVAPAAVPTTPNIPAVPNSAQYARATMPPPPPPPPIRDSAARDRRRKRRVTRTTPGGEWAWVVIALAMLSVVIVISLSLALLLRTRETPEVILPTAVAALPTPVDGRLDFSSQLANVGTGQTVTLDDGRSIVLEAWDGESRFTMLVMGLDRRPGEEGLAYRTDTMMLISLDPTSNTIGILSMPRDLYVEVPGYAALQRINTPMVLGELQRPGYGPELAMQTVQYNFGIRVHEYVAVDFNAVIKLVDLIGGIDVDVPYNIVDNAYPNMYYGYEPLYISAGLQHFDGATALKYARTRHGSSDFQRAERQQQVIYAVRDRVLDLDMLPQLIIQSPSLMQNFNENVYTGLTLEQIIQLALYVKDIPTDSIQTGVVGTQYVMGYTTEQGASVLIPNRSRLGELMVSVFGANYSE